MHLGAHADAPEQRAVHVAEILRNTLVLEVDVAGRKDGARSLVTLSTHATTKQAEAEAQTRNARLGGWEFEIPDYKYAAIFRPLEDLLKKLPQPVKKTAMESAPGKVPAAGRTPAGKTPAAAPKLPGSPELREP